MYTDSHCHLDFPELSAQIGDIRQAMRQAQVSRALCISTTLETFERVHALALAYPELWATVGVHPDNEGVAEPTVDGLLTLAARPRVVGIGETGLDYYRLGERSVADMEWQRQRFRVHIEAAQRCAKPLVIHTRSASDDTLAILREMGEARGVFHCFTETQAVARAALDMGFYISLSGIVTFRNARDLHELAAYLPLDRLLIETDSPYLAPVPHRGKVNTPAFVAHVAEHIAQLRGISPQVLGQTTTENFLRLFSEVAA